MAFVKEIVDLIAKLNFYKIVYEYQQGLYFRNGRALFRRRKLPPDELAEAKAKEKGLVKEMGRASFLPFCRKGLPEDFYRSPLTGFPKHRSRLSRNLGAGLYLHIPIVDSIVVESQQERVLSLGNINILSSDEDPTPISVSCNLRYMVVDFCKAYTAVHDHEVSLRDYTLAILAQSSRGRTLKQWRDPKSIAELEKNVEEGLSALVTEKWGMKIFKVYITDNVPSKTNRLVLDGTPINLHHTANVNNIAPPEGE